MAISGSSLADGQLPAAKGTLFTATVVTYEKTISLCNVGGATETVKIYFNRLAGGAISRRIRTIVLAPDASYEFTTALPMVAGDLIEGETTNATAVDYAIGGGITS
jgi:hypothetical protein